jgi:hypothetical protein
MFISQGIQDISGSSTTTFINFLFKNYEEKFQNFLQKLFKNVFNGEITSLLEISNTLFVLIEVYETYYVNLRNSYINTQTMDENNQQK